MKGRDGMFGYSMIQMVRAHACKLDKPLREQLLNLYKPFIWTPCFLHRILERFLKLGKKFSLIVEFENGNFETGCHKVKQVTNHHFFNSIKREFPRVSCCSVEVTPKGLEEMLASCNHIRRVFLNREVNALLDNAVPSAGAKGVVRDDNVLTGAGVTIAIIDTGIYPHQDLEGRIIDFKDFVKNRTEPYDDNGHGTHCAGNAAGNGAASDYRYSGPAPEANLIGVKVLDKWGSGSLETIMAGVEWCIQYNESNPENKIDIISMSLGCDALDYGSENSDPMVSIVEEAWKSGIIVCVAAGNSGPSAGSIASPGVSDLVITVGALDDRDTPDTKKDDVVAEFSSRGPTVYGLEKPDIVAPGVNIISLRSPKSYLDKLQKSSRVGKDYTVLSGTSMATPICAGIVALMKQHKRNLTPDDIKLQLKAGADTWKGLDPNKYGAGYINAENSIKQ
jgi:serine protease AprX